MATVPVHEGQPVRRHDPEEQTTAEVAMAGSLVELGGGLVAVILMIVALAGILPQTLTAIAAIALGMALFFEGLASAARASRVEMEVPESSRFGADVGSGMGLELICGGVGGVLGVLALLNIAPVTLLSVAAIVFGAGLIFGSGARAALSRHATMGFPARDLMRLMAREAMQAATMAEVVIGLAGGILGILALVGGSSLILIQVAMLSFGAAVLLGGAALSGRTIEAFRR